MTTKRTIGIFGALLGALGVAAFATLRKSLPQTRGTLALDGLSQPVEILRDRWGVPHIYAKTTHDLFMAQGFVHAQDRLWQMESQRRLGYGTLSELIGNRAVDTDRYMRILGLGRCAHADAALLSGDSLAHVTAYVAGVNAFLATHKNKLPPEFLLLRHTPAPWTVADVIVWGKIMALSLSGNWTQEILRSRLIATIGKKRTADLEAKFHPDLPLVVPAGTQYHADLGAAALGLAGAATTYVKDNDVNGSNNWVVNGTRTVSGKPLLANDPHLNLALPSIWYEAHLHAPDYHVAGASFAGCPGIVIGHNDRIAWGVTNGMIDNQDLFFERFDPADPAGLRYDVDGEWKQAELRYETIKIKGAAPHIEAVRTTRHGPIITPLIDGKTSDTLALRWTALDTSTLLDAIFALNRATDWTSFRAALRSWDVPPQNFVYADVDGHIGYQLAGNVPIRGKGDGRIPAPGWDSAYDWTGFVPFNELPAQYDPAEGFIATANNQLVPDGSTPPIIGEWLSGWRAARISQMIRQHPLHDAASFAAIHADRTSMPGLALVALAGRLPDGDAVANQARALLAAWDGVLDVSSCAATIAVQLLDDLQREVFAAATAAVDQRIGIGAFTSRPGREYMGRALPFILQALHDRDDSWFRDGRTWDDVLEAAWQHAVPTIRKRLGDNPGKWQYGDWHKVHFTHPLSVIPVIGKLFGRGAYPLGGNRDTVNMGDVQVNPDGSRVTTTPSYRFIADPSDWERSKSIHPGGQSGHPLSSHYGDFIRAWLNVEYHPMPWARLAVEEVCQESLTITPR
jgi:penicillin amidase